MLATLSRWRSWVQIPSRGLIRRGTQLAKRQSSNLCDSVGSTPTRATRITSIARAASVRRVFMIAQQRASAGHWRAQVAVTHPPSGIAGSTPARRTRSRTARSSSGSGCWPLKPATRVRLPHGSLTRPSGATGRHATLRTSCPYGLGSSTLPLVTFLQAGQVPDSLS